MKQILIALFLIIPVLSFSQTNQPVEGKGSVIDALPLIDTAILTTEDPREFLEWVTEYFIYRPEARLRKGGGYDITKKLWVHKKSKKVYTGNQLYNEFVYQKNECWWDDEEAIRYTREKRNR